MNKYIINYIDYKNNEKKGFHYIFASNMIWAKKNFECLYPRRSVVSIEEA